MMRGAGEAVGMSNRLDVRYDLSDHPGQPFLGSRDHPGPPSGPPTAGPTLAMTNLPPERHATQTELEQPPSSFDILCVSYPTQLIILSLCSF